MLACVRDADMPLELPKTLGNSEIRRSPPESTVTLGTLLLHTPLPPLASHFASPSCFTLRFAVHFGFGTPLHFPHSVFYYMLGTKVGMKITMLHTPPHTVAFVLRVLAALSAQRFITCLERNLE